MGKKVIVAITGASGSIYAKVLLEKLVQLKADQQIDRIGVVMSDNAKDVWRFELQNELFADFPVDFYEKNDFFAPFASGSAQYETLFVCPCSMGMLSRIAQGTSNDLTTRAADVILKERRKLILMVRDTPYNLIHIRNMEQLTVAGAIICPASPSFYSLPRSFEELAATVVDRALSLAGFHLDFFQWGSEWEL